MRPYLNQIVSKCYVTSEDLLPPQDFLLRSHKHVMHASLRLISTENSDKDAEVASTSLVGLGHNNVFMGHIQPQSRYRECQIKMLKCLAHNANIGFMKLAAINDPYCKKIWLCFNSFVIRRKVSFSKECALL